MLLLLLFWPIIMLFFLQIVPINSVNMQKLVVLLLSFVWQVFAICTIWLFNPSGYLYQLVTVLNFDWFSSSLVLCVDSIAIYLILLTTILNSIVIVALPLKHFSFFKIILSLLIILNFCMVACMLFQDILIFYIIFELSLIPLFILILVFGSGYKFILASYKLFLYTFISSLLMLMNLLIIYNEIGTLNYIELLEYNFSINKQKILWIAFTIVFLVKLPVVPFHSWLPLAHVSAPTTGSVLLAGIVLKLGAFGLIKYSYILFYNAWIYFNPIIIMLALFSLIYSSIVTLYQLDLKTIIAYSSIAHMSTILLNLSTNLYGCVNIANLMLLSHGLVSPGLFFLIGFIYDRFHTKWLNYLIGFGSNLPIWTVLFFLFTLANCAIPLSANFVAEFLTILYFNTLSCFIASLLCISLIIPTIYSFWSYNRLIAGLTRLNFISDINRIEFYILFPLLFNTIIIGLFPNVLLNHMLIYDNYIVSF
jgi:proton-translocating NADH-quinone oxidoreductase chain M